MWSVTLNMSVVLHNSAETSLLVCPPRLSPAESVPEKTESIELWSFLPDPESVQPQAGVTGISWTLLTWTISHLGDLTWTRLFSQWVGLQSLTFSVILNSWNTGDTRLWLNCEIFLCLVNINDHLQRLLWLGLGKLTIGLFFGDLDLNPWRIKTFFGVF